MPGIQSNWNLSLRLPLGLNLIQSFFYLMDNTADCLSAGIDNNRRHFPIERISLLKQLLKLLPWIFCLQQGAVFIVTRPHPQLINIGAQVDHYPMPFKVLPILRQKYRTAAGGQHYIVRMSKFFYHSRFTTPKASLSFQLKNQGDVDPGTAFNLMIRIKKFFIEMLGEQTSDSCFTCPHQSDKKYVSHNKKYPPVDGRYFK